MASIAAHFTSTAIDAAPHLQALYLVGADVVGMIDFWSLQ